MFDAKGMHAGSGKHEVKAKSKTVRKKFIAVNKVSEDMGVRSWSENLEARTQEKPLEKTQKCRGKVKTEHFLRYLKILLKIHLSKNVTLYVKFNLR